ncbi:MAG: hypothetical protein ABW157_18035 [Candidatus Thiodiazotropha sp. LLP2]
MKQTNLDFNLHANDLKPEKPSRPSPFCLRLSREERALLERAAGDLPLGTYIRKRLLNDAVASRRKVRKNLLKIKLFWLKHLRNWEDHVFRATSTRLQRLSIQAP